MSNDDEGSSHPRLKQQEAIHRVLANTVVEQLVGSGCEPGQLIDFASEVLKCIMDRGFADDDPRRPDPAEAAVGAQPVEFRLGPSGGADQHINGRRIVLRPVRPTDRPLLETWSAEEDIRRTFSKEHLVRVLSLFSREAGLQGHVPFIITDENGRDIGMICLFDVDREVRQAEMTKLLGERSARGKGYAAEAVKLTLAYAFGELKLRRVYLRTAGFNFQNIKLNEKVGFRFEGILRQSHIIAGKVVDVALMSILSHEFFKLYYLSDG
ncbi:MAG: GNAT family protein [Phycisphaerae bacterium]